jgi:hypothetical protein
MPERTFRILAYVDKVPSMASCNKCQRKFFTPGGMFRRDAVGAEEYLGEEFVERQCSKPRPARFHARHLWKTGLATAIEQELICLPFDYNAEGGHDDNPSPCHQR